MIKSKEEELKDESREQKLKVYVEMRKGEADFDRELCLARAELKGIQAERQRIIKIIDKFGQSPCGFMGDGDNLCDRIDNQELKHQISEVSY